VVAVTDGSGVAIWSITGDHPAEAACRLAGRNLTDTEWGTYLSELGDHGRTCPEFGPDRYALDARSTAQIPHGYRRHGPLDTGAWEDGVEPVPRRKTMHRHTVRIATAVTAFVIIGAACGGGEDVGTKPASFQRIGSRLPMEWRLDTTAEDLISDYVDGEIDAAGDDFGCFDRPAGPC
jgi:hypothetical protein